MSCSPPRSVTRKVTRYDQSFSALTSETSPPSGLFYASSFSIYFTQKRFQSYSGESVSQLLFLIVSALLYSNLAPLLKKCVNDISSDLGHGQRYDNFTCLFLVWSNVKRI